MVRRLFLFNPDQEMAIANGSPYYTPPARIVRMADELGYLPAYFSGEGDGILLSRMPEEKFIRSREQLFGLAPKILLKGRELRAESFEPWGWCPREYYALQPSDFIWNEERKELYSRRTAAKVLERLRQANACFESDFPLPRVCSSLDEIKSYTRYGRHVVKAPWSSSGKGLLFIEEGGITAKSEEWLRGMLRRQGYVMVETYLDKIFDFALEFYSDGLSTLTFLGLSAFQTGQGGEYKGNYVGDQDFIRNQIESYIDTTLFEEVKKELFSCLAGVLLPFYKGYLGVDMMIYRDERGKFRIQPCVEINLRYTMGILALFLSNRYLAPGSRGHFSISYSGEPGVLFRASAKAIKEIPLTVENGKIKSGYLPLTPLTPSVLFSASLHITASL